jgi:hypothetical protein
MLLFGAAVAYVRERQSRGGLWDASKDQRLPLNGWFSRSPGQLRADGLGLCAKKPAQKPAEPPGLDPLKQVGNIVLDWVEQKQLTPRDVDQGPRKMWSA